MPRRKPRQARERKVAEIAIEGPIGESFWDDTSMSAAQFRRQLREAKGSDELRLLINSPGGDVFDGIAIFNQLKAAEMKVTVEVEGIAASAASVIAMAGDTIVMREAAFMMIHDPWGLVIGNAAEMRAFADELDKIAVSLANIYARRTGIDADEVREMLAAETWMDDVEAVERGFADRRSAEEAEAAAFRELYLYDHVPERLEKPELPAAELQRVVRARREAMKRYDANRLKLLRMEIERLDQGVGALRRRAA